MLKPRLNPFQNNILRGKLYIQILMNYQRTFLVSSPICKFIS